MNAKNLFSRARCTQIIRRILGAGFVAIGLVEIYNWGVSPTDRIAWAFLGIRILFFFGPLLLTIGAFLIFYRRTAGNQGDTDTQTQGDTDRKGETGEQHGYTGEKGDTGARIIRVQGSKTLLWIGAGLITVPVGLLFMANAPHSEILGFLGGVTLLLFGLPGLVFIVIGAVRLTCLRLLLTTFSAHLKALWRD
jgi:hypothetical protein